MRGSTNIEILSDEDQELLRVACKACTPILSAFYTLLHTGTHLRTLHITD